MRHGGDLAGVADEEKRLRRQFRAVHLRQLQHEMRLHLARQLRYARQYGFANLDQRHHEIAIAPDQTDLLHRKLPAEVTRPQC